MKKILTANLIQVCGGNQEDSVAKNLQYLLDSPASMSIEFTSTGKAANLITVKFSTTEVYDKSRYINEVELRIPKACLMKFAASVDGFLSKIEIHEKEDIRTV